MEEMENIQDQPEFQLEEESIDLQAEMPVYEQPEQMAQEPVLPEEVPQKKKKTGKFFIVAIACLLALAILASGTVAVMTWLQLQWGDEIKRNEQLIHQMQQTIDELRQEIKDNSFTGNGNSVSGTPNVNTEGLTPAQVYAQSVDSIVTVSATVRGTMGQQGTSSGSGFVISEDGYIVTNYHVVEGATKVTVMMHSSLEHRAEIVGYDEANDVAVLKIEAKDLKFLKPGSSDDLIVGDQVVAIGNPLGELTSTMTVGYVSAKDRMIETEGARINMIQTDVAINSGNSGGPLLNMKGEVIGITTAKYSGTTSSGASIEGISFAVPMDDVLKKINDLREYGYITGAALGVMVHDVDQETAVYYGLPMGAYVAEVNDGSAAAKAGLQARDIIIGIGEDQVTSLNELSRVLEKYSGGEDTTITVWRGGREVTMNITLDARTPDF